MIKKAPIINLEGNKVGETELPSWFHEPIRQDIIAKVFEASKIKQPYGTYILAGKEASSGKQRHRRRKYKTLYGLGLSRVPRKVMSRRGERFYLRGAFVSGTVGGREAHPPIPSAIKSKINKKEKARALKSALAATSHLEIVNKRYNQHFKIDLPIVIDKIEGKPKQIKGSLLKLLTAKLGNFSNRLIEIEKKIRAGIGKSRGRKYKKAKGMLLIVSSKEKLNFGKFGIETVNVKNLNLNNLAPGGIAGRFVIFTSEAVNELKTIK